MVQPGSNPGITFMVYIPAFSCLELKTGAPLCGCPWCKLLTAKFFTQNNCKTRKTNTVSTVVTEAKNNTRFISWVVRCTIWLYTIFKTEWAQSVSSISNKKYTEGMIWFQTNIAWNNLNLMDDNNPGSHHCELILQKLCIWAWQITAMPSRTEHCNRFLWHSREIYAVNPCMLEHEGLVFNILRSFQQLPLQPLRKLLQTKFISLHFSMKQSMIFLVKVF